MLAVLLGCFFPAPHPQAQPAPPPIEKKPDAALDAARVAFEALPESDRRALQDALVWTGDYNSVDSGAFGRRSYEAVVAYQRRTKMEPTGVLDAPARAAVFAAGRKAREAAGFAVRIDAATGVAIGVPAKLLPRTSALPHGTRWQSADGRVTLETRSYDASEQDLAALFDRLSASTPERKVTYKLKRPDFIVVTGETAGGRFFIRYAPTPAGLRGFTLAYDKALAADTDKIVIAVANSFVPMSAVSPPAIVPTPVGSAPGGTLTALDIGPGRLLTSAEALGACATPRFGTSPVRIISKGATLVLLESASKRPSVLGVGLAPAAGAALIVVANGPAGAQVASAEALSETRMSAPLQPGAAGAPAFDRSGRLIGLVASYPATPQRVADVVPPAAYGLVTVAAIRAFLKDAGVAVPTRPDTTMTAGEIAALVTPSVQTIACGG